MLTNIKLENFKCFKELDLTCAPLTLLTGINGTGKSSVFQALVLLRQTVEQRTFDDGRLFSKGPRIDLGSPTEFLYEDSSNVRFVLEFDVFQDIGRECVFDQTFHFSRSTDQLVNPDGSEIDDYLDMPSKNHEITTLDAPPFGGEFVYIGADRAGPRITYPSSDFQDRETSFGTNGELAWNHLNRQQLSPFDGQDPRFPGEAPQRMLDVVNLWLQEISPGANIHIETLPSVGQLLASFSFNNDGDVPSPPYRARNVGFGLSYTLPVIVALLMPEGTLCMIENPEAHLHPRGQTKLAELAARAAMAGVQVFVETHSDHFIDGIRIAVREGLLTPEDTIFHYFERNGNESVVSSPVIDSDGRLSEWPAGFFDQYEENLSRLLAPRN